MGHHDIETVRRFRIKCLDCDFKSIVESPGVAEQHAHHHIKEYREDEGSPNYGHSLIIESFDLVSRQPDYVEGHNEQSQIN
jgi:hypothetical protein